MPRAASSTYSCTARRCRRWPAGLNFGDLFAYALARAGGDALLFKGDDFTKTDITAA